MKFWEALDNLHNGKTIKQRHSPHYIDSLELLYVKLSGLNMVEVRHFIDCEWEIYEEENFRKPEFKIISEAGE